MAVSIVYGTSLFYVGDRSSFLRIVGTPKVLQVDPLVESSVFHRGDGIILEYTFEKHEVGCYADYQTILVGPASIQLPMRRSQFIGDRGTVSVNTVRIYAELPQHMPLGTYDAHISVFPICDGVPRDAFRLPIPKLSITIE
jgi:hypothetical protein